MQVRNFAHLISWQVQHLLLLGSHWKAVSKTLGRAIGLFLFGLPRQVHDLLKRNDLSLPR